MLHTPRVTLPTTPLYQASSASALTCSAVPLGRPLTRLNQGGLVSLTVQILPNHVLLSSRFRAATFVQLHFHKARVRVAPPICQGRYDYGARPGRYYADRDT